MREPSECWVTSVFGCCLFAEGSQLISTMKSNHVLFSTIQERVCHAQELHSSEEGISASSQKGSTWLLPWDTWVGGQRQLQYAPTSWARLAPSTKKKFRDSCLSADRGTRRKMGIKFPLLTQQKPALSSWHLPSTAGAVVGRKQLLGQSPGKVFLRPVGREAPQLFPDMSEGALLLQGSEFPRLLLLAPALLCE